MDLVLVGLPGSGKSAVGKRLARSTGATFIDLDEQIEAEAGRPIPAIFAEEGEAGFRARERAVVAALGAGDSAPDLRRIIATGGGTVVDPRNRWKLYRGRLPVWLDGPPEVFAQRLRSSPNVRPLIAGRDPIAAVRALAAERMRFYAPALRVNAIVGLAKIVEAIERHIGDGIPSSTRLLDAETPIGRFMLGDGHAAGAVAGALARLEAPRAIIVSEPGAWKAFGSSVAEELAAGGMPVETVMLPQGEAAKTLAVVEQAARQLARLRVERGDVLVAIGGGALGDTAGFIAATFLRGIPIIHVPTTLLAMIDSSIGGKTAVDLPEGKNLVGAFHQPAAIIADVRALRTLPTEQRRAALGEAVKMGVLGDERLLQLLESDGRGIAEGTPEAFESGAVAEMIERAGWAKVEVVVADEREHGGRINLNLGHSIGHAIEGAAEYEGIFHGEAVAYGTRGACRIGVELGVTPPARAARVEALLDSLELAQRPLPWNVEACMQAIVTDKKHKAGRLRWVIPTENAVTVRTDVPEELVERTIAGVLQGDKVRPDYEGLATSAAAEAARAEVATAEGSPANASATAAASSASTASTTSTGSEE